MVIPLDVIIICQVITQVKTIFDFYPICVATAVLIGAVSANPTETNWRAEEDGSPLSGRLSVHPAQVANNAVNVYKFNFLIFFYVLSCI